MAIKKLKQDLDINTEAKIKNAARIVFHQKGFAATRTRDIAEAADINLALLNYYFRSKEKLFNIIMMETFQEFIKSVQSVFNDEKTSLEKKIELIVGNYIELLTIEPQIPLFILSEIRNHPEELLSRTNPKDVIMKSFFAKQYQQAVADKKIAPINIVHFILNLLGLTVFPFIASPMIKGFTGLNDEQFNNIIQERKKMIPIWMKAIMKTK